MNSSGAAADERGIGDKDCSRGGGGADARLISGAGGREGRGRRLRDADEDKFGGERYSASVELWGDVGDTGVESDGGDRGFVDE